MTRFEILTKHGRTQLDNGGIACDKIETATAYSIQSARGYVRIQKEKFPDATIVVRNADSLVRVRI